MDSIRSPGSDDVSFVLVTIRPMPNFGGLASLFSADASFLCDRDFLLLRSGDGGGLVRINRVKSSPGRTATGGVSNDDGRGIAGSSCCPVDGGGSATVDAIIISGYII